MKKLLELEARLKKAKEELEKQMGMDGQTGMPMGAAGAADVNVAKKEHEDEKEDKEMIEEKLDEHNEDKHGEAKDEDSAKKSDVPKEITDQTTSEIIEDYQKPKGPLEEKTKKPKGTDQSNDSGESYKELDFKKGCKEMIKFEKNGQWSID